MAGPRGRLVDPKLVHGLARVSTGVLLGAYDDARLGKLQDDLSRDLGRLEGRHQEIAVASRQSAHEGTLKVLGWAIAVLSFCLGFVDVVLTGEVGTLAALSLGFGAAGFSLGLLMDRREGQRQRARNRALEELRKQLRDLTIALARVRAARSLRPSAPVEPDSAAPDR